MSLQTTINSQPTTNGLIQRLRSSIVAKLILLGIVLTTIPTLIIGIYVVVTVTNSLESTAIATEQEDTEASGQEINNFLLARQSEILFISQLVPVQDFLDARAIGDEALIAEEQAKLEQEFLVFSSQHPFYTQLRYIDETGQEVIRVDIKQRGQVPQIVPQNQLQNKADRGYFQETNQLTANGIYASAIELNREQGQIELLPDGSYRPVIRYGTPVFDKNGQRRGIVVSNIFADDFLASYKARAHIAQGELAFIVDNNGFYLAHSADPSKEWGGPNDLGSGESLLNDFPQYGAALTSGTLQTITTDSDFFITGVPMVAKGGDPAVGMVITFHPRAATLASVRTFQLFFVAVLGVALVLAVGVILLATRRFTRQTTAITQVFDRVNQGDLQARVEVMSEDELGQTAVHLNNMLDNTTELIQTSEERDSIQSAIIKLLDEVAGVADGDLTIEAEVTSDMTGAIADSFNFMITQLREIIGSVQETTLNVSSSANEIQTTAEHLAEGSETQSMQIVDTSAALDEMTVSIQQVSENAARSATVADQALQSAQQGAKAVSDTIEGMNRIREQSQETAKRIKRLGESSQEIGEIVQVIRDIAKRTSLLALNASLEAAAAGEAGRGFAVVAEDVKRLSQRSSNATLQIAELIQSIQSETNAAVAAMEATTREVVVGSALSNEAGSSLAEIETVSNQLSELIQSISLASKQQARGSENIARSMNDIAEVTQQTAAGTKQAAVSINNLANLAEGLRNSVSAFRLPARNGYAAN